MDAFRANGLAARAVQREPRVGKLLADGREGLEEKLFAVLRPRRNHGAVQELAVLAERIEAFRRDPRLDRGSRESRQHDGVVEAAGGEHIADRSADGDDVAVLREHGLCHHPPRGLLAQPGRTEAGVQRDQGAAREPSRRCARLRQQPGLGVRAIGVQMDAEAARGLGRKLRGEGRHRTGRMDAVGGKLAFANVQDLTLAAARPHRAKELFHVGGHTAGGRRKVADLKNFDGVAFVHVRRQAAH